MLLNALIMLLLLLDGLVLVFTSLMGMIGFIIQALVLKKADKYAPIN